MKHPSVFENYASAEALEKILEENGLPVVPTLTFDGKKNAGIRRKVFLHFYLAGSPDNRRRTYFKRAVR